MAEGAILYTKKGYEEEKAKLEYLQGEKRAEIIRRIDVARGFGDLSENSEYTEARNDQRENEAEIERLQARLNKAEIYDESELNNDVVNIGNVVTLKCLWNDKDVTYNIVGSSEADPLLNRISIESPVGAALFGRKVGDRISVQVRTGVKEYKILDITTP